MTDEADPAPTVLDAPPPQDETKREELKRRVAQGEKRIEERSLADTAREAAETATEFVKKHPLATVAGVGVVALAIGAMTRPGRRAAHRTGMMAALARDAALTFGMNAIDRAGTFGSAAARATSDRFEDFSDDIGSAARSARREALYRADVTGDSLRNTSRRASRKAGRTMRDLRSRFGN